MNFYLSPRDNQPRHEFGCSQPREVKSKNYGQYALRDLTEPWALRNRGSLVSASEPLRGELLTEDKLSCFPHEAVSQAAASIRMYSQYSVPNLSMLQVTVGSPLFS